MISNAKGDELESDESTRAPSAASYYMLLITVAWLGFFLLLAGTRAVLADGKSPERVHQLDVPASTIGPSTSR